MQIHSYTPSLSDVEESFYKITPLYTFNTTGIYLFIGVLFINAN